MDAVKTKSFVVNICEAHPGDWCWSDCILPEDFDRIIEALCFFLDVSPHSGGMDYDVLERVRHLNEAMKTRG